MSGTTSRLAIPYSTAGDLVSGFPSTDQAAQQINDLALQYVSGTLASRPAANTVPDGFIYRATDDPSSGNASGTLWLSNHSTWTMLLQQSGGSSIVPASQSTSNPSYTTLSTPDQVAGIVLPTSGLIRVTFQASWVETASGAASAAIFVGANQLKIAQDGGTVAAPQTQSAGFTYGVGGVVGTGVPLYSSAAGLACPQLSGSTNYSGDVTTGQAIRGGACLIFAAAGTYTVSVQFKTSSGSVTVANRHLFVDVLPNG